MRFAGAVFIAIAGLAVSSALGIMGDPASAAFVSLLAMAALLLWLRWTKD